MVKLTNMVACPSGAPIALSIAHKLLRPLLSYACSLSLWIGCLIELRAHRFVWILTRAYNLRNPLRLAQISLPPLPTAPFSLSLLSVCVCVYANTYSYALFCLALCPFLLLRCRYYDYYYSTHNRRSDFFLFLACFSWL